MGITCELGPAPGERELLFGYPMRAELVNEPYENTANLPDEKVDDWGHFRRQSHRRHKCFSTTRQRRATARSLSQSIAGLVFGRRSTDKEEFILWLHSDRASLLTA